VMGVFNGADRLQGTISSVLAQADCDLEFIVVNDGSTDATAMLLDKIGGTDARLRVIHQANAGLTRALIAGCAAARAPFIARQDAGDTSGPGRLHQQLRALQKNAALSFVSCTTEFVEPSGAFLYRSAGTGRAAEACDVIDLREEYGMIDGPSHHGSVMFRREHYELAGGYRPEFYFGQDWDLWFRLAQLGKFELLPQVLYRATIGLGDISTSHKPLQEKIALLSLEALRLRIGGKSDEGVLQQAGQIRPPLGGSSPGRQRIASGSYFLGECLRRNGNNRLARQYHWQALRNAPWSMKTWVRLAQAMLPPHRTGSA
jgi:glycosyltransferase involved in cell wall biosynthesis